MNMFPHRVRGSNVKIKNIFSPASANYASDFSETFQHLQVPKRLNKKTRNKSPVHLLVELSRIVAPLLHYKFKADYCLSSNNLPLFVLIYVYFLLFDRSRGNKDH